ncbi:hypothetical protein NIES4101_50340 [Calothrix sp. NIES-4101]|nr:hypothetical protein NIES4101_50340 [Calothrix sp. NIES-4101]
MNNKLFDNIIPQEPPVHEHSDAHTVKARLEWGEPALTILDVRDRQSYNQCHIMGAMPAPMDELQHMAESSLHKKRDIYIYGANDEETDQAAKSLRDVGFSHVSSLRGGLEAWKAIGGSTEGTMESQSEPDAGAYNVVDRIKTHLETQQKEV